MAFKFDTALLGISPIAAKKIPKRRTDYPSRFDEFESFDTFKTTLAIIVISALLFVSIVAVFEVVRLMYISCYTRKTLQSPIYTHDEVEKTLDVDETNLNASRSFALFTLIVAFIGILFIYWIVKVNKW